MQTVGVEEVRTDLPRLLEEVARGETITITKSGVPVAALVPVPVIDPAAVRRAIGEWETYRDERNLTTGGVPIREMIEEGRH